MGSSSSCPSDKHPVGLTQKCLDEHIMVLLLLKLDAHTHAGLTKAVWTSIDRMHSLASDLKATICSLS